MTTIETEEQLENALSTPGEADVSALRSLDGEILILGAGGKMGPSLARLAHRASDAAGKSRRIIAVSRFSVPAVRNGLESEGIETVECDLLDPEGIARLPRCENVLFMAGRKFGSTDRPDLTWAANTLIPGFAARHFSASRIVAFSTGNVYPFVPSSSGGSVEEDPPQPEGEYAQSCLGRERVFEHHSREAGTKLLLFRLNYATDLRYGILVDIARKVHAGRPVSLAVGCFNTIWQRDANSYALRSLAHCQSPPLVLNITGPEIITVRRAALFFADRFGRKAAFDGDESGTALLSNAAKCHALLGPPLVSADQLMSWVAHWVERGGANLNKPTHFEVRDGKY